MMDVSDSSRHYEVNTKTIAIRVPVELLAEKLGFEGEVIRAKYDENRHSITFYVYIPDLPEAQQRRLEGLDFFTHIQGNGYK